MDAIYILYRKQTTATETTTEKIINTTKSREEKEMYYSLDAIKEHMEISEDNARALAKSWNNITFPTKKDGTPFANMKKNFAGAYFSESQYATYDFEKVLRVYTYGEKKGYHCDDMINCYDWDKKEVNSLDEIKEKISERAEYWTKQAEEIENDLANIESIYNNFSDAFKSAVENLKGQTENWETKQIIRENVLYNIR